MSWSRAITTRFTCLEAIRSRKELKAWQPTNKAWEYKPASDGWKALAPMPTPRGAVKAVELNGRIYVIGGVQSNEPGNPGAPIGLGSPAETVVGTMEVYDPATNTWEKGPSMPTARNHYEAVAVNGKIYAIDGRIGTTFVAKSDVIDLVEVYNLPAKKVWSYATRSPTARGDVTGAVYNGKAYVTGGEFQDTKRKMTFWAEILRSGQDRWAELPHMLIARHGFAAASSAIRCTSWGEASSRTACRGSIRPRRRTKCSRSSKGPLPPTGIAPEHAGAVTKGLPTAQHLPATVRRPSFSTSILSALVKMPVP